MHYCSLQHCSLARTHSRKEALRGHRLRRYAHRVNLCRQYPLIFVAGHNYRLDVMRPSPGVGSQYSMCLLQCSVGLSQQLSWLRTARYREGECDPRAARHSVHEPRYASPSLHPVLESSLIKYLLTGGPGVSGVEALNSMSTLLLDQTGGYYDIVSWDPRGVGNLTVSVSCYIRNTWC